MRENTSIQEEKEKLIRLNIKSIFLSSKNNEGFVLEMLRRVLNILWRKVLLKRLE